MTPNSAEVLLERAATLARGVTPALAVPVYRDLLASEPEHIEARLHLARLLDRLEESGGAIELLSEGLGRVPDQTELLVLRGAIRGRVRRYDEAESDLRRVLRLYPSHSPAEFELGLVLWRKGMVPEAAAHFRQALDSEPDNARASYYLADALNHVGDLAGAHAALVRALQAAPRDGKAYHLIGRVLDRMGRTEEAREMYQRGREVALG